DGEPRIRSNAIWAVGRLDPARASLWLTPLLGDPNNRARAGAVVALGQACGEDHSPVLSEMAKSPVPRYRISAIWAASTLATPRCLEVLGELLKYPDIDTAERAQLSLDTLSASIPEATAILTRARK